ncbi:MAG: sugar-transfer associated ATP-grasp domain-containing protein [Bacteroidota bacterium]
MALRFLALPYCFFFLVNWDECKKSKIGVCADLLYIFFALKYYPYNYSLCRLWEKDRSEWRLYYGSIYEPYQRARLSKEVQREEYKVIFDDKEVCHQICKSLDLPLPQQVGILSPEGRYDEDLENFIDSNADEALILKPVRGSGGKGILLAYRNKKGIEIKDGEKIVSLEKFFLQQRSVVEIYLEQHPGLDFGSKSFNTIRIVTLLTKYDGVLILGAFMRFGLGDSYLDNTSAGGVTVGIDIEKGLLGDIAHDFSSKAYESLPGLTTEFAGALIPFWEDVKNLAEKTQESFGYYKLLGLDIGITPAGPVLVEINPSHDNIGLEQATGPLLSKKKVKKAFAEYGLLL